MEFLNRCEREGDQFWGDIITMGETWICDYDPETQAESSVWKTPRSPLPKKARVPKSGGKHIFMFLWIAEACCWCIAYQTDGKSMHHTTARQLSYNGKIFLNTFY